MNDSSREDLASLVANIADEFVARQKRGEQPDVEEYLARHPQASATLRRVLAALQLAGPSLSDMSAAEALSPGPPELGTLGDYRLLREVGRGGMGVVYEAEQISLHRRVALKVLPFASTLDPRRLQRFHNEALAAASLHHEHVVAVHAVGCERGVHYYAMHFVEGRSLADIVASRRVASPSASTVAGLSTVEQGQGSAYHREVARLGADAARALEHAHVHGVLHRDVKPGNLMMDHEGKLWVTDFGLARLGNEPGVTMTGDVLGTLRYSSPEQALAKHGLVDHRTDVYSLGATLYELLTLQPAITGKDREEVLRNIAFAEPVAPRKLVPSLAVDLETVVLKALAKEPAERYVSAAALAHDLQRFLSGLPVEARRPGVSYRVVRWVQRHAGLTVALIGLLLFAALAVAAGALYVAETGQTRAAQVVAETQRFYRLLFEIKERQARKEPGWTWDNLAAIEQAAALPDAADKLVELRSLVAQCVMAPDLRRLRGLAPGFRTHQVAFRPDGKWLALVQGIGAGSLPMRVRRFDPATWEELAPLTFPSNHEWQEAKKQAESTNTVAFSADSRWLAVGTRSGWVHAWDLSQPSSSPQSWQAFPHPVTRLAFGPGGRTLFALSREGVVERWKQTREWAKAPLHKSVKCRELFLLSPELILFLRADGWVLQLDGDQLLPMHLGWPGASGVTASPNGRCLAWDRNGLRLFDLLTQHEYTKLHEGDLVGAAPLAFSPDGRLLVGTKPEPRELCVWDVASRRLEFRVAVPMGRDALAFSPDGRWLVVSAEHQTFVYEIAQRSEMAVAAHQCTEIRDLAFTASSDLVCRSVLPYPVDPIEEVTLWLSSGPPPLHPVRRGCWIGIDDDAQRLTLAGDVLLHTLSKRLRAWDLRTDRTVDLGPIERRGGLAADARGWPWVASRHHVLRGPGPMEPLRAVWENSKANQQSGLTFYSLSARRRWVLVGRRDGRVFVFRVGPDQLVTTWTLSDSPVTAISSSADESRALVGTEQGQLFLVAVPSGQVLRELTAHHGSTIGVAFAGNLLVTGSADRTLRLWSTEGELLLSVTMEKPIERLAVSADGTRLAVSLEDERAVRLWELDRLASRLEALGLSIHARLERAPPAPLPRPQEPPRTGNGLLLELFAGHNCLFPLARWRERSLDFRHLPGSPPPHSAIGERHYSLRWTGWIKAPRPGDCILNMKTRHGARLWLDDRLIIDNLWEPGSHSFRVARTSQPHAVRVEYAMGSQPAECSLSWCRDGRKEFELVPPEAFFLDRASAIAAPVP